MFGRLMEALKSGVTGKRSWTPREVRELIDQRKFDAAKQAADQLSPNLLQRDAERASLLGEIAFLERRDADAEALFKESLAIAPGMAWAHYGLSLLYAEKQDLDSAVQHAQFAQGKNQAEPRFLAQLGFCHLSLGNLQIAEAPLRAATRLDPRNASAWNNLGIVLRAKRRPAEARDCFQRAVTLNPSFSAAVQHLQNIEAEIAAGMEGKDGAADAHGSPAAGDDAVLLATVRALEESGDLEAAIDACEDLTLAHPDVPAPVIELQRLYERAGDPQSGLDALEAYVSRKPADQAAIAALGLAHSRNQRWPDAERRLRTALEAEPDRADLLQALAHALSSMERYAEAMPLIEKALELAPADEAIRGLHIATLTNACRYEEAVVLCEEVRKEGKEIACYGTVLVYLGRFDEAKDWLDRALVVQPSDPNLRFQRSQIHLLRYDFGPGWDDYAYRGLSASKNFRVLPYPLWRGEPLKGKRIVVLTEQGLGDQVMFASCLPDLLKLEPSEVVVEVIGRIAPTIERSFPQCRVIATLQDNRMEWVKELPAMDYYVPLGELPRHFRRSLADFPAHHGYLVPSAQRVAHWKRKLEALGPGPYIGLSWKGGTEVTRTSLRSMSPAMLAPLAKAGGARFVCLQYGKVAPAVEEARAAGLDMAYWPEAIENLDEFAALISALDLVITVCNTTVHYAGAVGREVWVLSPQIPEWRYGIAGATLPWYPSSRMFRQEQPGEWTPTIDTVCRELLAWVRNR